MIFHLRTSIRRLPILTRRKPMMTMRTHLHLDLHQAMNPRTTQSLLRTIPGWPYPITLYFRLHLRSRKTEVQLQTHRGTMLLAPTIGANAIPSGGRSATVSRLSPESAMTMYTLQHLLGQGTSKCIEQVLDAHVFALRQDAPIPSS